MKIDVTVYNSYTEQYEVITVGFWDIVKVLFGKPVKVGERQYAKWEKPIMFYMFYCSRQGFTIDYPHGYSGYLDCT